MKCRIFDIEFKNPVFLASGTFEYGLIYRNVTNKAGAICTKGITARPRGGNPPPRIFETACGLINSVGLENPGVDVFCKETLPRMRSLKTRIFVNVAGFTVGEFVEIVGSIGPRVDGFELNVSCPNVDMGGVSFGRDPDVCAEVVARVRAVTELPLIVKLTANFCDPLVIARRCMEAGADGISLINTLHAMAFDLRKKEVLIQGGLSGPAIKPFALYCVHRLKELEVPIIGVGGIMSGADAYEFLLAGASAVEIGSAILRDPYSPLRIIKELKRYTG
ncbi:MAG: dihydroorotate dehydrogenase [candidate division WOR-3 bacterium]|nr:MAG: dihydroorotate dehydrogenase [candidate division WOR-3 bacterium]